MSFHSLGGLIPRRITHLPQGETVHAAGSVQYWQSKISTWAQSNNFISPKVHWVRKRTIALSCVNGQIAETLLNDWKSRHQLLFSPNEKCTLMPLFIPQPDHLADDTIQDSIY